MRYPIERGLFVEGLEYRAVGRAEPHALVGIATRLVAEDDLARREAAGLDVAHLELRVDHFGYLARLEVHLTNAAQGGLDLNRLVRQGEEGGLLHALTLLGRALTLDGDVGVVVVAIHGVATRTTHLGREGGDELFVRGRLLYLATLDIRKELIEVHDIHVPCPLFAAADEHAVCLVGQVGIAQIRPLGGLDDLSGGHLDKVDLCRSPLARLTVGHRALDLLVVAAARGAEQQVFAIGRPHRVGLIEESVVFERVGQHRDRVAGYLVHIALHLRRCAVAKLCPCGAPTYQGDNKRKQSLFHSLCV